jgi:hypothetical protein
MPERRVFPLKSPANSGAPLNSDRFLEQLPFKADFCHFLDVRQNPLSELALHEIQV